MSSCIFYPEVREGKELGRDLIRASFVSNDIF